MSYGERTVGRLLMGLLAVLIASTNPALAQQQGKPPTKTYRIGVLSAVAPSATWRLLPSFRGTLNTLTQLGYVEGKNLAIEFRSAEAKYDRLPEIAAELAGLKPDAILVGTCGAEFEAIRRITSTIPLVVGACTKDMVASGVIASLARPGGNVTGIQKLNPELAAKRLELVRETLPKITRVAVLWDPEYSDFTDDWRAIRSAARQLDITLLSVEVRGPADIDAAFSAIDGERAEALVTFSDPLTYNYAKRLARLSAERKLPTIFAYPELAHIGSLMNYGPNIEHLFSRAVVLIDKILRGAKPADVPVEEPTRFELVVNLKVAKELKITIPPVLLVRADRVIE
jgi:putative ABC transport system substrate-binding protein